MFGWTTIGGIHITDGRVRSVWRSNADADEDVFEGDDDVVEGLFTSIEQLQHFSFGSVVKHGACCLRASSCPSPISFLVWLALTCCAILINSKLEKRPRASGVLEFGRPRLSWP